MRRAVAQTREAAEAELRSLDARGRGWASKLTSVTDASGPAEGRPLNLGEFVTKQVDEALASLRERAKHLDKFHVVMFGRTGAGKSSMVEILSHGDGKRISRDGRLDYTRKTQAVEWHGIRVLDTPGIQGWAAHEDRQKIEAEAHDAVKRADIVLLAFDDYNQKIGEFDQIGKWVEGLGKAAIAVLNLRDAAWRYDARLEHADHRDASVQQVREHARHVERMLDAFSLRGTPLVAANLAWAFAARGKTTANHPEAETLDEGLAEAGRDGLLRISNFGVVEAILTTALTTDAMGLRLGALRRERAAALDKLATCLGEAQYGYETQARQAEDVIATRLALTGMPSLAAVKAVMNDVERAALDDFRHRLTLLGASHAEPRPGIMAKTFSDFATAPLAQVRGRGLRAAQKLLHERADDGKSVDPTELQKAALDEANFTGTLRTAAEAAYNDLVKQVKQADQALRLDFELEIEDLLDGFDAKTGAGKRRLSRITGYGAAAAAGVAVVALTGGAALAAGIVIGGIGRFFSKKQRRAADEQRLQARLRAERETSEWLDRTIVAWRADAERQTMHAAWLLGARSLAPDLKAAVANRQDETVVRQVRLEVYQEMENGPADAPKPCAIIGRAVVALQQRRFPQDPDAAPKLLLGEDWLGDGATGARPAPFDRPRLGDKIEVAPVALAASDAFWRAAETTAKTHPVLAAAVAAGRGVLDAEPVVAFSGDYSSGKSSLVRRLAANLGLEVDPTAFAVGAEPTTSEIATLRAPGMVLCDTPGLGSEVPAHTERALRAAAGASLIVCVHTAVSGDLAAVVDLLHPEATGLRRDARTLHLLGRIDGLSVRPDRDPEGFMRRLEIKRRETAGRLADAGLELLADMPLPVAGDPGKRHAQAATWSLADFLPFRGWDGIDDLQAVLLRVADHGRAAAAIDLTASELADVRAAVQDRRSTEERTRAQQRLVTERFQDALARHGRVEARVAEDLQALVDAALAERLDAMAALDTAALKKIQEAPERWIITPTLVAGFVSWRRRAVLEFEEVYRDLVEDLEARIGSRAFQDASKAAGDEGVADALFGVLRDALGQLPGAEKMAADAAETLLAKIPALMPFAERLGVAVGRAAGAVAGVALEAVMQKLDANAQRKREQALEDARQRMHDAGRDWCKATLEGTGEEPGVLTEILALKQDRLQTPLDEFQAAGAEMDATLAELGTLETATRALIDLAGETLA